MVVSVKRFTMCFHFLKFAVRIKLVVLLLSGFIVCVAGLVIRCCFIVFVCLQLVQRLWSTH